MPKRNPPLIELLIEIRAEDLPEDEAGRLADEMITKIDKALDTINFTKLIHKALRNAGLSGIDVSVSDTSCM